MMMLQDLTMHVGGLTRTMWSGILFMLGWMFG